MRFSQIVDAMRMRSVDNIGGSLATPLFPRNLIIVGKDKPSQIVSQHLPLDQAPNAYKNFDERDSTWTKVILNPGGSPGTVVETVTR